MERMPGIDAADVFLIVASICIVLLTLLAIVLGVFALKAILEIRSFTRLLKSEVDHFREGRRRVVRGVRFARRWLTLFVRRATESHDS